MGSKPGKASKATVPPKIKALRQKGHDQFNARNNQEARSYYIQALDNIEALTYTSQEQDQFRCDVYLDICDTYRGQGSCTKAKEFSEIAQKIADELNDGLRIAHCLDRQGAIKKLKKNYSGALIDLKDSLELKLQMLGDHNLDVATSYYNLGNIYDSQKKYDHAETMHQKALDIRLILRGVNHIDVAKSYDRLGNALLRQHRHGDALLMYQNALVIRKELYGENHLDVADSYNNIGKAYANRSMYDQALSMFENAAAIYQRIQTVDKFRPEVAIVYQNIANTYEKMDKPADAVVTRQKMADIRENLKAQNHQPQGTVYHPIS